MISPSSSAVENMPVKKSSAAMRRLLVMIVAPEAEARRRIIGVRIVVGDRAANGAAIANLRIADRGRHRREPRQSLLKHRRIGRVGMTRHGADDDRAALLLDTAQALDQRQIDERRRLRQPLLHHRQERMSAGQQLGLRVARQQTGRLADRGRTMESEIVHSKSPVITRLGAGARVCSADHTAWRWPAWLVLRCRSHQ